MRKTFTEEVSIPEHIHCEVKGKELVCKKGENVVSRSVKMADTVVSVSNNKIKINSLKANRKIIANIRAFIAHLHNIFAGLVEPFVYEMEICNVHFPMTVKVEGNKFIVTNFLGEKEKRIAVILPSVKVDVKAPKITVTSHNLEAAGQTAANIEKATNVPKRDRRVYQDGIFITSKCGRAI